MFMNYERNISNSADPARNEPSEARTESCDFEAGGREPDATDFIMRLMKRAAVIGAARLEVLHERSEAEHAAWREAAATAPAERDDEPDIAAAQQQAAPDRIDLDYQNTTRAMRYCALLVLKAQNERLDREMGKVAEKEAATRQRKSRRKAQLERLVGEAIQHQAKQERERPAGERGERWDEERLYEMLPERLEDEDIERDIDIRPMGELVLRVCREWGFEPDLSLWDRHFWALEEARCQTSGSPFAGRAMAEKPVPQKAELPEADAVEPDDPEVPETEPEAAAEAEDPKPPEPEPEAPEKPPPRTDEEIVEWQKTPEYERELAYRQAKARTDFLNRHWPR
jgi:hypothetical protein